MKVTFTHSEIKQRRRNLYYVNCQIEFNEEERSVIRERSLSKYFLPINEGSINYPPTADPPINPAYIQSASRYLFMFGIPFLYFNGYVAALLWITAAALFIYRMRMKSVDKHSDQHEITIKQIIDDGSFSACVIDDPTGAKAVEEEIRTTLAVLKHLIAESAAPAKSQTYEL
jgi:hypothetical protein